MHPRVPKRKGKKATPQCQFGGLLLLKGVFTIKKSANLDFTWERNRMFDSLEDQMKAEDIEGSPEERLRRYIVIGAVAAGVVAAIVLATEFLK
jgi:hypothetical protein